LVVGCIPGRGNLMKAAVSLTGTAAFAFTGTKSIDCACWFPPVNVAAFRYGAAEAAALRPELLPAGARQEEVAPIT
jgi:hypothetical protein